MYRYTTHTVQQRSMQPYCWLCQYTATKRLARRPAMLMKSSTQSLTEQLSERFAERIRNRLLAPARACRRCASALSKTA